MCGDGGGGGGSVVLPLKKKRGGGWPLLMTGSLAANIYAALFA